MFIWLLVNIREDSGEQGQWRSSAGALAFPACVASVCNRVIARKVERKRKKGWRGRGGEGRRGSFFPLPLPRHFFFFLLLPQLSRRTSRGNACYAGYRLPAMSGSNPAASTPYVGWVCCWFSSLLQEVSPVSPVLIIQPNPIFFFQFDQYRLLVIQSLLHSPLSFMQCESSSKTTRHSIRNRQRWQLNHLDPRDLNLCFWFIYLWNLH